MSKLGSDSSVPGVDCLGGITTGLVTSLGLELMDNVREPGLVILNDLLGSAGVRKFATQDTPGQAETVPYGEPAGELSLWARLDVLLGGLATGSVSVALWAKMENKYLVGLIEARHKSVCVLLNVAINILSTLVFLCQNGVELEKDGDCGRSRPGVVG